MSRWFKLMGLNSKCAVVFFCPPQLDSTACKEMSVSDTDASDVTWTDGTFNLSEGHTPQTENSEGRSCLCCSSMRTNGSSGRFWIQPGTRVVVRAAL